MEYKKLYEKIKLQFSGKLVFFYSKNKFKSRNLTFLQQNSFFYSNRKYHSRNLVFFVDSDPSRPSYIWKMIKDSKIKIKISIVVLVLSLY